MEIAEAVLTFVLCALAVGVGGIWFTVGVTKRHDRSEAIIGILLFLLGSVTAVFQGIVLAM